MEPYIDPHETSTAERVVYVVGGLALSAFCLVAGAVIVTARFDERAVEAFFLRLFVALLCGAFALLGLRPSLHARQERRARDQLARWLERCPACGEPGSGDCARCGHPSADRGRRWRVRAPRPADGFVGLLLFAAVAALGLSLCAFANASRDVGSVILGWAVGALLSLVGLAGAIVMARGIRRGPPAVASLAYASRWSANEAAADTRVDVTLGDVAVARGLTRIAVTPPPRDDGDEPDAPEARGLARLVVRVTATHRAGLAFGRTITWNARGGGALPVAPAADAPYRTPSRAADDGFERADCAGWHLDVREGDLAGLLASAGVGHGVEARELAARFDGPRLVPVAVLWSMVGACPLFRRSVTALGADAEDFDDTRARLALRAVREAAA